MPAPATAQKISLNPLDIEAFKLTEESLAKAMEICQEAHKEDDTNDVRKARAGSNSLA